MCVDIKENSLKHLADIKKTSFSNVPWMSGSIVIFAAVFCFSLYTDMLHPLVIRYVM